MSNVASRSGLSVALWALLMPAIAAAQVVVPSGQPQNGGPADPESAGAAVIRPLESVVPNPRSKGDARSLGADDARFLQQARIALQGRIDAGRLAAEEGAHPCVRKYAGRVVEDHVEIVEEIDIFAASRRLSLSTALAPGDRKLLADLQRLSGPSFDRRFADAMHAAQQQDLAEVRRELAQAQDGELKWLTRKTARAIAEHVDMADVLTTMVGGADSASSESALPQGYAATGCAAF